MPMGSKCHTGSINTHFLDHALAAQLGSLVLPCDNFNMILFKLFKIQNDQIHSQIHFRISFGQKIKYILNDIATTERVQEVLLYGTGLQVSSCWCCLTCIWRVRVFWGLGWLCSALDWRGTAGQEGSHGHLCSKYTSASCHLINLARSKMKRVGS